MVVYFCLDFVGARLFLIICVPMKFRLLIVMGANEPTLTDIVLVSQHSWVLKLKCFFFSLMKCHYDLDKKLKCLAGLGFQLGIFGPI